MQENTISSGNRSELPNRNKRHYRLIEKSIFFLSLVLFMLLSACTRETLFIEEEHAITRKESSYLNPELQPFAAWLRSTTPTLRSSIDPEIGELIEYEKKLFDARFSYIQEYFKIIPAPRWYIPRVIRYDDDAFDVFVLCGNTDAEKIFENDLVLIISKRANKFFSYIKMLPKNEYQTDRLKATYQDGKIFLETGYTEPDGTVITQNVGFLTKGHTNGVYTRGYIDCQEEVTTTIEPITYYYDGGNLAFSVLHKQLYGKIIILFVPMVWGEGLLLLPEEERVIFRRHTPLPAGVDILGTDTMMTGTMVVDIMMMATVTPAMADILMVNMTEVYII